MTTIRLQDVRVTYEQATRVESSMQSVVGGLVRSGAQGATFTREGAQPEPPRLNALDGVDLEIRHGETMGILGPSGCGKSTLLRAISGLMPLQTGIVTFDDQDMAGVPPGERGIGIVFQNYALYPNMTSLGNVGFFFRLHHREEEIPERVREVSRVMGIGFDKLLSRHPARLSGGERQRVAVARCIARDPKLFLFDEPLSNLDAKLRVQTRAELKRIITRFRTTGVYVTHDQHEALALCDRIAIMREGKIEQVGTGQFIYERPVSIFVASFFGHPPMNLFEGTVVEGALITERCAIPLPDIDEGRRLTLGVRADGLRLDPDGPIQGEVVLIEPEPVQRAVLVYLEHGTARMVAQVPLEAGVRVGDMLSFQVDTEHVHRFDTRTGRRL